MESATMTSVSEGPTVYFFWCQPANTFPHIYQLTVQAEAPVQQVHVGCHGPGAWEFALQVTNSAAYVRQSVCVSVSLQWFEYKSKKIENGQKESK